MSGPSPMVGGKFHDQLEGGMANVASMLKMSSQDMKTALGQTGGDLLSLAKSKGVSGQQVVDAVKQGLTAAGSQLSGARLDNIASRIALHKRLAPPATPDASARPNFAAIADGKWSASSTDFYA